MILREEIVSREWKMFQNTQNKGGRASCQDDYDTFYRMRMSQFEAWNDGACVSYLDDLEKAEKVGRNLIAEKYFHMMKYTHLQEYENQKHLLPVMEEDVEMLAKEICDEMVSQTIKLHEKYPLVGTCGRPILSESDKFGITSIQTYQLGELLTYSAKTLRLLKRHLFELKMRDISLAEEITSHSVCSNGFSSLKEAEEFLGTYVLDSLHKK